MGLFSTIQYSLILSVQYLSIIQYSTVPYNVVCYHIVTVHYYMAAQSTAVCLPQHPPPTAVPYHLVLSRHLDGVQCSVQQYIHWSTVLTLYNVFYCTILYNILYNYYINVYCSTE